MVKACYTNSLGDSIPCVVVNTNADGTVDVAGNEDSHVFIASAKVSPTPKAGFVHLLDAGAKPKPASDEKPAKK